MVRRSRPRFKGLFEPILTCPLRSTTLISRIYSEVLVLDRLEISLESLPEIVRIHSSGPLSGTIIPPSSKYHTLRYILAAFLAPGMSTIYYPAISDDTNVLLQACCHLGAHIQIENQADERRILSIRGTGGILRTSPNAMIDVGNAGAVLRLLLGICALSPEAITFTTPYPESLGRRPNADLLQSLAQLGATVESQSSEGTLPITLRGGQLHGGNVQHAAAARALRCPTHWRCPSAPSRRSCSSPPECWRCWPPAQSWG